MKATGTTILVILVAISSVGSEIHAEPSTPVESKTVESHLDTTHFEADGRFHIALDASISYGPISGYVQTPQGGAPSSTSEKRPRFEELGIDTVAMANISLLACKDPHSIYAAAHLPNLGGQSTLDETLIFHGQEYPAGTTVKADVKLNWYEIGYQYHIHFGRLSIAPTVALTMLDFSAELESHGEKNDRSYAKGTPRIGLELEWPIGKHFSVSGNAIGSLPLKNTPGIYTVGFTGKYDLVSKARLKISLIAGIEYDQIDYEDSQATPNHISASMGPLGLAGVEIRF